MCVFQQVDLLTVTRDETAPCVSGRGPVIITKALNTFIFRMSNIEVYLFSDESDELVAYIQLAKFCVITTVCKNPSKIQALDYPINMMFKQYFFMSFVHKGECEASQSYSFCSINMVGNRKCLQLVVNFDIRNMVYNSDPRKLAICNVGWVDFPCHFQQCSIQRNS